MPLLQRTTPFDDHDWIFELKYDGFRALKYDGFRALAVKFAALERALITNKSK